MAAASLGTARQSLRAPQPRDTEDRDGEVPICQPPCPAPRRARLTLAFFSLLCRVASGTRSSSSLLHPNSGSVSALAPKTPALWRPSPVPLIACVRPTFSDFSLPWGSVSYSPSAHFRAAISSVRSRILPWATDAQENGTPSEEQVAIGRTGRPREDRVTPGKQDTLPRKDRMPPGRQDAFWGSPRTTGAPLAELSLGHRGRCWAVGGVRERVSLRVLLPPSIVPS